MSLTNVNERRIAADLAYDRLAHWVGDDATRETAAAALATAKFRSGLSDEIRDLVLERFEPEPEREPVAGVDFLPVEHYGILTDPGRCACGWEAEPIVGPAIRSLQLRNHIANPSGSLARLLVPVMHKDVPAREWGELP